MYICSLQPDARKLGFPDHHQNNAMITTSWSIKTTTVARTRTRTFYFDIDLKSIMARLFVYKTITHAGNIINGRCHWCFPCNSKHSVSNLPRIKVLSIFACQSYLFNNSDYPWDDICKLSCRRHCGVNTNAILTINYLNARKRDH